jgi:tyrosyl-DNA phosphodiesterase 2
MDKVLFCGGVRLVGFERFGMDVVIEDEKAAKELVEGRGLEKAWVTDHLGVKAEFVVEVDAEAGAGEQAGKGGAREGEQQVGQAAVQRSSI